QLDRSQKNELQAHFGEKWWTGLAPKNCPGFDIVGQSLKALPLLNLQICSRQDIIDYFNNAWTLTELLFASLKTEQAYMRPPYHHLRHPLIFYYGHTAVLFLNKLRLAGLADTPVDLYLEKVLETGVDEMSWDDMSKNDMEWPSVSEVKDYRQKIYDLVLHLLKTHPDLDDTSNFTIDSPWWALFMSLEHEKIHFETSSVLIRELPIELVEEPTFWPKEHSSLLQGSVSNKVVGNEWIEIKGKDVKYGKPKEASSFGWDNEYGTRSLHVKDFKVTQNLITNGEYYEFVKTNAYTDDTFWSEEGVLWRKFRNTKRPTFWVAHGPEGLHEYKLRTIFNLIDMPWDWPVEVNFHEAEAFAKWKSKADLSKCTYRLPTEGEHHLMRDEQEVDLVLQEKSYAEKASLSLKYNFNFTHSSPRPVQESSPNHKGIRDVFGNVWQWTLDQFNPLDNFKAHKLYDDFSVPCFDGKHQMILGGSFISCGHEASKWARFHFRPHFFQHAGFRLAASLDGSEDNGARRLLHKTTYVHQTRTSVLDQIQKDGWWKSVSQPLELSSSDLEQLWSETSKKIIAFENTRNLSSPKGTALDPKTNDIKQGFRIAYQGTKNFPDRPDDFSKLLKLVVDDLVPTGQLPGHSGYMAYVSGAGNAISNMAQALSQTFNQYTAHFSLAPGLVALELEVLKWMQNMVGYSVEEAGGFLTTGGSLANLSALSLARTSLMKGYDLSQARFYSSQEVHHSVGKSLSVLGFPKESLVVIKTEKNHKLDLNHLKTAIEEDLKNNLQPICIIATAGSTNTGTVDPICEISDIAKKFNLWLHVDAAYGGFFMLTEMGKKQMQGIENADSVALDPHKSLSLPYGTGSLLVKDKRKLIYKYAGESTYMPPSPLDSGQARVDFADISPELSRDFRGLRLWLPIKTLGIGPFQLNLEEKIELTKYFVSELRKLPMVQVLKEPDLTITNFMLSDSKKTKTLLEKINATEKFFLTGCTINNAFVIRVCLLGFRAHYQQVKDLLQFISDTLKSMDTI
ncbi:MAG: 5-histidylcysteine sulfoxide synthase, partial [Bdellovibrionales bacterium]|nr:5-histidylcysteine sulfoxide synthase [Bdellovibrionales bacterium]